MKTKICCFVLLAMLISSPLFSQVGSGRRYIEDYTQGFQAYNNKDLEGFLTHFKRAYEIAPDHLRINYFYAAANVLNNNIDEAFRVLDKLSTVGADYGFAGSPLFAPLKEDKRFEHLIAKMNKAKSPVLNSKVAFTLPEKGLLTEGIAYDAATGDFYVSSVHKRKIVKVNSSGEVRDFISEGQDGIWSVLSLKVDTPQRILWASSVAMGQTIDLKASDKGKTAMFKYDLDSGKLIKKFELTGATGEQNFNDMTVLNNGDIFITNATGHSVYRILHGTGELEMYLDKDVIGNVQGITVTPDQKYLFISSYNEGVFRVSIEDKKIIKIQHPKDISLFGIDGLYFYKNCLVAIHNGVAPHKVVQYFLNTSFDKVMKSAILELGNENLIEPTLGVVVEDEFFFIANSQWPSFKGDGTTPPDPELVKHIVMKVKLH